MAKANSDCSILAVANEGEGSYDDFLINPEGSVSLIRGPFLDNKEPPAVTTVTFPWSDAELLAKGVHLPLSKNSLEYWDEHSSISEEIDFTAARESYTASSVLEPEWLVWSADEKYVLVNLQENAALVKVNVETSLAEDGCENMPKVAGLHSVRTPDSITAIIAGDDTYIATANEVIYGFD